MKIKNLFTIRIFILLFSIIFIYTNAHSQKYKLSIENKSIPVNGMLQMKLTAENAKIQSFKGFPDLKNFRKSGTNSSTKIKIINGKRSFSNTITQNYNPQKKGKFNIPSFTVKVNNKKVKFDGATIKVGPKKQRRRKKNPFSRFFGGKKKKQKQKKREFIDVEADAFLGLQVSKSEIYTGEGITVNLALYISRRNKARLALPNDIKEQFSDIFKKMKPDNCWEEKINSNTKKKKVTIKDKQYLKFTFYEGRYFPFNSEDIKFPSVPLKIIKYKEAKNPSFFGKNLKKDYKTFYTKPKTVKVKSLPPHPLKDQVSVGKFELKEELLNVKKGDIKTGKSFNYNFTIRGEGNIKAISKPDVPETKNFNIYPPDVLQNINRKNDLVTGSKKFKYYLIPQEPGEYNLGKYFKWVYFDPYKEKYDTLKSDISLMITGKSQKNMAIKSNDLGGFYNRINNNSGLISNRDEKVKLYTNIALLIMIILTFILTVKNYIKG